jgi:hypothetical protein
MPTNSFNRQKTKAQKQLEQNKSPYRKEGASTSLLTQFLEKY